MRMVWNSNGTLYQQRDSAHLVNVLTPAVTTYGYHPTFLERHDSIQAADGTLTRFSYWPSGLINTITAPTGHQTQYVYETAAPNQGLVDGARVHRSTSRRHMPFGCSTVLGCWVGGSVSFTPSVS
jgi:YD repeat-containing protein